LGLCPAEAAKAQEEGTRQDSARSDRLLTHTRAWTGTPVRALCPPIGGVVKVILNYGMGVDSTVILHRWLSEPSLRDFDLADLIVVSAQTGNEFPDTKRMVEEHVFPLMRGQGVRYVQLARAGLLRQEGIVVLSDTRRPEVLHTDGVFSLLK